MDLALFDFDGTISQGDCFTPFIHFATPPHRLALVALVLGPQIIAYKRGWLSAQRMRTAIVRVAFGGRQSSELRELGESYACGYLETQIRKDALERIRWHQARGDKVVVVSASLNSYLIPWCERQGLDLICTELEVNDGIVSNRRKKIDCSGPEKSRRIQLELNLEKYDEIYAYGDTVEDREMLQLAVHRFYRWQKVDELPFQ